MLDLSPHSPRVSCRAFVLERAQKHLGHKFVHSSTGKILEEGYFDWSVGVSKYFGGLYVAYGGYVVWRACGGWCARPFGQEPDFIGKLLSKYKEELSKAKANSILVTPGGYEKPNRVELGKMEAFAMILDDLTRGR